MEGLFLKTICTLIQFDWKNSCNFCYCLPPKSDAVIAESTQIAPCRRQIMITAKKNMQQIEIHSSFLQERKYGRDNLDSFEPWIAC